MCGPHPLLPSSTLTSGSLAKGLGTRLEGLCFSFLHW